MSANPILYQGPQVQQFRLSRKLARPRACSLASHLKIYLVLVGTCGLLLYIFSPAVVLIIGGILIGTPLLVLATVEARHDLPWLNPLSLFLLYLGLQLGPAAAWEGVNLLGDSSVAFPMIRVSVSDVATGYFLTLIGTCVMALGLRILRPHPGSQVAGPINWKPKWIVPMYAVGIAATLRPSAFLFLGAFGGILQFGPLAVLIALAFSRARGPRPFSAKLLFVAGVTFYVLAALFSENSSKSGTMLALLPIIVFVTRNHKYRKWIPAAAVLLAILYLGVVAPAVNSSRNMNGKNSYDRIMMGLHASSPFYTGAPLLPSFQAQLDQLMRRLFEMPPVTGFMVNEVRRSGFQLGGTMGSLYYAFIPRIVWPGKPLVSRGAWFTAYLRMAPREEEATTSTGMTIVGEWYWNFGIVGVIGGIFLTGLLLSGLWRMAGAFPIHQPVNMLLYVALIINVLNLPDATSPIVSTIALYLLFGSLTYLLKSGKKRAIPTRPTMRRPLVLRGANRS
jgi:hypothetical protein